MPFKSLNIDLNGLCYLCVCEAWLPISVGNILDFNRLEDVWANPIAQRLQQDIKERKYTHCAVRHCGVLEGPVELSNFNLGINIDESCNLACPSCRKSAINHTGGEIFNIRQEYVNHLIKLIQDFNQPMNLVMCGNGDPLASLIMRPLILNWKPKDNQTITLRTNGLLMRKLLPDSLVLPQIKIFEISVDAGSQEVYENVRRPGKFSVLQENLQWLSENRPTNSKVHLLMCVQKSNANDIINFADMCKKYGFVASFTKLEDWHTFANFEEHDVIGNINHPLRDTALNELRTVYNMSHVYLNPLLKNLL
jgi:molybdenum cofactor biosynthesis enzyme MoaA